MKLADIPIDEIDPEALPRDRSSPDPAEQDDLIRSIAAIGLHSPIEVFGIDPDEQHPLPYGLISGHRRLAAFRALGRTTIPALLHNPETLATAMAAMVAENEIRAPISPWEKGRFLSHLIDTGHFPHAPDAIAALYPSATRQQRNRLANAVLAADTLDGLLTTPESLTHAQIDRLAAALRAGGEDVICLTLRQSRYIGITRAAQWQALEPTLNAILYHEPEPPPHRPRREPRHSLTLPQGLTLKRELTRTGWVIRFSGEMAKSPGLVDDVFELVERWLGGCG